jgi:hypothetical protein
MDQILPYCFGYLHQQNDNLFLSDYSWGLSLSASEIVQ